MSKPKIAILGGGIGALSTVWNIVRHDDWQDRFQSITVYQMGWRLGGKCATGRGPCGRVEEHGIHLFGGGYYNTLRMMRDVYRDLFGTGGDAEFKKAFEHQFTSVSVTGSVKSATKLPTSPITLDGVASLASLADWIADALGNMRSLLRDSGSTIGPLSVLQFGDGVVASLGAALGPRAIAVNPVLMNLDLLVSQLRTNPQQAKLTLATLRTVVGPELRDPQLNPLASDVTDWWSRSASELSIGSALLRWARIANFITAFAAGCLELLTSPGITLKTLDDEDYAAWLKKHGAWPSTIELDIVQAPIRILYQYKRGDASHARHRSMGAGVYLHWSIRTFAYVSAPFWFFEKGTGDSVIAPIYECLKRRGVRFEFFRKIENVELNDEKNQVSAVTLRVQATTQGGTLYQPLEAGSWPARPRDSVLQEGQEIGQLPPGELESYWSKFREKQVTRIEVGRDFDLVVFAISLGAIPFVCKELLAAQPAWRDMVANIGTVETQSLQIWMDQSSHALGVNDRLNPAIGEDDTGLGAGFAVPFDGFSDFSQLLSHEQWPSSNMPRSLWYFSDVLKTPPDSPNLSDHAYPKARRADVVRNSKHFFEVQLGRLLSKLSTSPGGSNYKHLVVPNPSTATTNAARLDQQWIRANVEPSDRYVQALSGTTRFRLPAGRSQHFVNLYLAGDWTFNGLNVGCVEATVMSGMLAANDLLGEPHAKGVIGYFGP
jgi:uncharacterized protein with NAD-binding domain and iron-sulfur cluster